MKERINARLCPVCGRTYREHPALSRADNQTLICPDCGTREALSALGIEVAEQNQILEAIHRSAGFASEE